MNKIKNQRFLAFSNSKIYLKKRGVDKMISMYWFVILFIVAVAVVYMAVLYYGKPYDVRDVETTILTNKIADCFSRQGILKQEVFDGSNFLINEGNFLEICDLDFKTEEDYNWEDNQYYVKLDIFDFTTKNSFPGFPFEKGNQKLKDCSNKLDNFPFCIGRSFYVIDELGNQYVVNIFSSVRKTEKNVI
ncbi:MAG: hypothetical protein ABIH59_00545 [archaeon]